MAKVYEGRWLFIRNIGQGGQGTVSLVSDESGVVPGDLVMKRLINANDAERRARFERETKALESLDHPNILRIYHKELDPPSGEKPFFIAEYCEGGSLDERGAAGSKDNISEAAAILLPIVRALRAAHVKEVYHGTSNPRTSYSAALERRCWEILESAIWWMAN